MFEYDYLVEIVILEINERRYAKRFLPPFSTLGAAYWELTILNFRGKVSIKLKKSKGEEKDLHKPGNFHTLHKASRKDNWLVTTDFDFPPRVFEEGREK